VEERRCFSNMVHHQCCSGVVLADGEVNDGVEVNNKGSGYVREKLFWIVKREEDDGHVAS